MFMFAVLLNQGISSPVLVSPNAADSQFTKHIYNYVTPDGIPYFQPTIVDKQIDQTRFANKIEVLQEPQLVNNQVEGKIAQYFSDININVTKNYRNRLTGAVTSYLKGFMNNQWINVEEYPQFKKDISWALSYSLNAIVFGMLLTGLLFGALSFTQEAENDIFKFLILSPMPPMYVLTGKICSGVIKGIISTGIFTIILAVSMGKLPDNWGVFILGVILSYIFILSLGLIIGILASSTLPAFFISLVTSLTLWIVGGGFGSMAMFSDFVQKFALINPATHILNIIRYSYFGGYMQFNYEIGYLIGWIILSLIVLYVIYEKKILKGGAAA
jgi:ABC-2 type transport system permease protein